MVAPEKRAMAFREVVESFIKGSVPLLIVAALVGLLSHRQLANTEAVFAVLIASLVALWLGWKNIKANPITKWVGIIFLIVLGEIATLGMRALTVRLAWLVCVISLLAGPFIVYDLFFRAPFKGRFERARAARRNRVLKSQP